MTCFELSKPDEKFNCVCFSYDRGSTYNVFVGKKQLIKGMDKALVGMCVNERSLVKVPPHLAYGKQGYGVYVYVCFKCPLILVHPCVISRLIVLDQWGQNITCSPLSLRTSQCLFLWRVIINSQMSEHTAGTAHLNNERIWSDIGSSVRDKNDSLSPESAALCCTRVRRSRKEVGCSKASMLNDVRGTSQTRKPVWGSCSGSRFSAVCSCTANASAPAADR